MIGTVLDKFEVLQKIGEGGMATVYRALDPKSKRNARVTPYQRGIMQAVASGEVTPDEGIALTTILDRHRKSIETLDLEARITALEEQ